jgi:tRNA pseudouridine55 synthase
VSPAAPATPPRRAWCEVDGIVLLDKPPGLSSNQALQRVRRLLAAAKGGHAGTLDPMATGMLPLCFGQATKACGPLLGSTKSYSARLVLGSATDTGDADGAVIAESPVPGLDPEAIGRARKRYTGSIDQVPPMYSALKRDGRPLYELARRGEQVDREARSVRIERLDLLAVGDKELSIEVVCSKGTYIRVLGEDIAAALGTRGHLAELRRLWVEPFQHEAMVSLGAIEQWAGQQAPGGSGAAPAPWLLPVDRAFTGLPRLDLGPLETLHLRQGRKLQLAAGLVAAGRVRAYGADGGFLGLVTADIAGEVRVERLFVPGAAGAAAGET